MELEVRVGDPVLPQKQLIAVGNGRVERLEPEEQRGEASATV